MLNSCDSIIVVQKRDKRLIMENYNEMNLAQLVNVYFDLKNKKEILNTDYNRLRDELIGIMESNNLKKLNNGNIEVSIRIQKTVNYDNAIDVLKGIDAKYLTEKVDNEIVNKAIADNTVTVDLSGYKTVKTSDVLIVAGL